MGSMSDLDIVLTEASEKGEAAGARLRKAIANLGEEVSTQDSDQLQAIIAELKGAAADAHDAATDLPIELRQFFNDPEPVPVEPEPQLVTLVKEIHEAVLSGGRLVFEIEDGSEVQRLTEALAPGDIVLAKDSGITLLNGTVTSQDPGAAEVEHPVTEYGARIFYADGTMEEIHHIDGVQVAKLSGKDAGTFPFAFLAIDGEDDLPAGHCAGYFDEEGTFTTFSDREAPRPGW